MILPFMHPHNTIWNNNNRHRIQEKCVNILFCKGSRPWFHPCSLASLLHRRLSVSPYFTRLPSRFAIGLPDYTVLKLGRSPTIALERTTRTNFKECFLLVRSVSSSASTAIIMGTIHKNTCFVSAANKNFDKCLLFGACRLLSCSDGHGSKTRSLKIVRTDE